MSISTGVLLSIPLACLTAGAAQAQVVAATVPSPSLFGSGPPDNGSRHRTDLTVSFDPTALSGSLAYQRKAKRVTFDGHATSTVRRYFQFNAITSDHTGAIGLEFPLQRRTRLSASQRLTYYQNYQLAVVAALSPALAGSSALAPGAGEAAGSPLGSQRTDAAGSIHGSRPSDTGQRLEAYGSTTNVHLTHTLSPRSVIELDQAIRAVSFVTGEADLRIWSASSRLTRRVARGAAIGVGYGHRRGLYNGISGSVEAQTHDFDFRFDLTSFSGSVRPTRVSVSSGATIVDGTSGDRRYHVTGEASAARRLSRSWLALAQYGRRVQMVEGFLQPMLLNSASSSLRGHVSRRLELGASVDYSRGLIGSPPKGSYDSYAGSARAIIGMSRHWALSLDYLYYIQQFRGDATVPGAIATALNRHNVYATVRWWSRLLR
jgi:hypothetical protein